MFDRWHFPMSLLRIGSLTLMCVDSLIVLGRFRSSPHADDVNNCGITSDIIVVINREGGLEVFLELLSR